METFIKIFSFKGRANRAEYWFVMLPLSAIILIPAYLYFEPHSSDSKQYVDYAALILFWPALAVQVRRWHDRNKSGWWVLINFIPLIGFFWSLVENGFLPSIPSGDSDHIPPSQQQTDN